MKIVFVFPPQNRLAVDNLHGEVNAAAGRYPPLGILYTAAAVERAGRHEPVVVDSVLEGLDTSALVLRVMAEKPGAVGIYATTYYLHDVHLLVAALRAAHPELPVILGGPHVRVFPAEAAAIPGVSAALYGESEDAINVLLDRIAEGKPFDDLPGIVTPANRHLPPQKLEVKDIDALPFPARHLVPYKKYWSLLSRRNPITTMMSSRGCPFHCHFCNNIESAKTVRMHTPGRVADEMERVRGMGIRDVFFFDEIFTFSKPRVFAICDEFKKRGLDDMSWHVRSRIDTLEPDTIKQMASAGCRLIQFGIETGTDHIQKVLNKNLKLERIRQTVAACRDNGVMAYGDFMLGNPEETREEMLRTVEFAVELKLDYAIFGVTQPLYGTELYERGKREGRITSDYWREFVEDPSKPIAAPYWHGDYTMDEMNAMNSYAYRRFYLRPGYIWQRIRKIDSFWQAWSHAKTAAQFFL